MQTSVKTSELLRERIKHIPERMDKMIQAIHRKDFQVFSELTMKVLNGFFAKKNQKEIFSAKQFSTVVRTSVHI